jgi:hypothetical protein
MTSRKIVSPRSFGASTVDGMAIAALKSWSR